jgi:hypothetical protein
MKILPSSRLPDSLLGEIADADYQLELASMTLANMEQEVDDYEKSDPRRLPALRLVMETRLDLSKQFCRVAMIKAKYGIVGYSWYKADKKP